MAALLPLLVQTLDEERHPAAARLEEGDLEPREADEHAIEDHRGDLAELGEDVRAGMRLDELGERLVAGDAHVGASGVDGDGHFQLLGRGVDGVEALVAEQVVAIGREHGADEPQLAHRAAQLLRRRLRVLQRQQGDALEARAHARELLGQHGVVGPAQRHRPLGVAQEGGEEPERGIEHRGRHAAAVQRLDPALAVPGPVALRPDEPPIPGVLGEERRLQRAPAVGLVEIPRDLLGGFRDVAVAVDDVEAHGLYSLACLMIAAWSNLLMASTSLSVYSSAAGTLPWTIFCSL